MTESMLGRLGHRGLGPTRRRLAALVPAALLAAAAPALAQTAPPQAAPAQAAPVQAAPAGAPVTLRMTWYSDGNEGEVMADLLKRFEGQNPTIRVVLDQVPFKAINETLPVQLAAGQGPDMARVADLGGVARYTLDLRPHLRNAAYFEENYGPFLTWMRLPGDTASIPGYMTQLTVTGAFANKTLFEQAGVPLPGAKATWEDWARASKQVADKVKAPFPIAIDRSGHRFLALAVNHGASIFNDKGEPIVIDDGLKRAASLVADWHKTGIMSRELWGSVSGTAYRGANEEFKNAQVALYVSGSWQIGQFNRTIGDAFDWVAVPNPCGPANCSAMPGGAGLVAIKTTRHPAEVARVIEWLAAEPQARELYSRALFVPGHLGLARAGIDYPTATPQAAAALKVFGAAVPDIAPLAHRIQGYVNNRIIFNALVSRLGQVVSGESSLDDAYGRIASDVTQQIAERTKN